MNEAANNTRITYPHIINIQTRWADNDLYGHVNNTVYYEYFDTAVNVYLIEQGGLDIFDGEIVGVAVETHCQFAASVAYPDKLEAGLRVGKLGNSSVRYEIGIFKEAQEDVAAWGHFVHVFVDRKSNKPVLIPAKIRSALEQIKVPEQHSSRT